MIVHFVQFFTGLGPIIKIGSIAILIGALWWGKTYYDNRQRNIGAEKKEAELFAAFQVESEQEWEERLLNIKEKEELLDTQIVELGEERAALSEERDRVRSDRITLSREIASAGENFSGRLDNVGSEVSRVPDIALRNNILDALSELRQFDSERNTISSEGGLGRETAASDSGRTP